MAGSSSFGKQTKSAWRGIAAQKAAIDSLQNIANVDISDTGTRTSVEDDEELAAIVKLLKDKGALAVGEVAKALGWDSDKAATALSRGGGTGALSFFTEDAKTKVRLATP